MAEGMLDFGLISDDARVRKRIEAIANEFDYSFGIWNDLEEFFEAEQHCKLIAFSVSADTSKEVAQKAAEAAQLAKAFSEEGYLISIVSKGLPRDEVEFIQKSGVNLVIPANEVIDTGKMDFFASQVLRSKYIPIKDTDIIPETELQFDLFHLMPLRSKFLRIAKKGRQMEPKQLERMHDVNEFYVLREELPGFKQYTEDTADDSHAGLLRRCRGQFLEFSGAYLSLVEMMCDDSKSVGFEEGRQILEDCKEMVTGLAQTLSQVSNAEVWDIINNSVIGEFGSVERMPAIAAYATHFSTVLDVEVEELVKMIFAILVMDIGLIMVQPTITEKFRYGKEAELTEEELGAYHNYPKISINVLANKKLPVEGDIKDIILLVNEKADGTGFPSGHPAERLTFESQLIRFCKNFDKASVLKTGEQRVDHGVKLKEIVEAQVKSFDEFQPTFSAKLKKLIPPST
ncbi:MAG: hypothetical protein CL677_08650 [Bdellovibrionaceae bacterium]|nr:hypothetical protein [Pseudobdellovibrionaceae bacterium]|tara:strand:+ start:4964 stop:6337 length:1374 start_codon:yes stop_codon:yes gene_type:complete